MAIEWALPIKDLYDNRKEMFSTWDAIVAKVFGPKSSIAFVGPGGVGKTVLLDHITGAAFAKGYQSPGQSRKAENGKAKADGNRLALVVAPGQGGPQVDTFAEIFGEKNPVDGVVFVAGNGFISLRKEEAIQQNRRLGFDTIEKWRAQNLVAELEYLKEVAANIRASNGRSRKPVWMLVAATKADLLFDELEEVERYYSPHGNSEFAAVLNSLVKLIGTDNFEWDALPVCSTLEDFAWGAEVARSKLDEQARNHYLSQMVVKLGELCQ